jgi:hypothetical protein
MRTDLEACLCLSDIAGPVTTEGTSTESRERRTASEQGRGSINVSSDSERRFDT